MKTTPTQFYCDSEECNERTRKLIKKAFKPYKPKTPIRHARIKFVPFVTEGKHARKKNWKTFYILFGDNKRMTVGHADKNKAFEKRCELEKKYGKWRKRGEYPEKGLTDIEKDAIESK